jgi:nitrogen regulatory protein PII
MHDMSAHSPLICLCILVPVAAEDRVVDWLLTHEDWQIEFSVHPVAARGPLVKLAQDEERVQGFAQRVELKLIIQRAQLDTLIDEVCRLLTGVDGGYWVVPIERFATFAIKQPDQGTPA